jgi:hypothetical protein
MRITVARGVGGLGASSELLNDPEEVRIFTRKVELLCEAIADG